MTVPFKIVIPARLASKRLPGKPLLRIGDKTLIEHVYLAAARSNALEVIIATDDQSIAEAASAFGARAILTSSTHVSGTERIAEAVSILGYPDDDIVVNVQGDEYGIEADLINTVARSLHNQPAAQIATLAERITDPAVYHDPHSVKVVVDENNFALYFSRSPVPWTDPNAENIPCLAYKHTGLYAYRSGFLKDYVNLQVTKLEQQESLEQLRALYHGYKIYVELIPEKKGLEINTEQDLVRARGGQ